MYIGSFYIQPIYLCLFGAALLLLILVPFMIWSLIINRKINIRRVNTDKKWVLNAFDDAAENLVTEAYALRGISTTTQQGAYRVNYVKDVHTKYAEIVEVCCEEDGFSGDFCDYAEAVFPEPRVKELAHIIESYMTDRQKRHQALLRNFVAEKTAVSPEEFFRIREHQRGDLVGVYILHNQTKDMYYVGQAKRLFLRINQHFTGHGNGDVYADYKYGDTFTVTLVELAGSGYSDLDLLEKDLIRLYHANETGYNRLV